MSRVGFVFTCRSCGSDMLHFVSPGGSEVKCSDCGFVGDYIVLRARKFRQWEEVDLREPIDGGDSDG